MIRQFLPKVNWYQLALMYFKDRSAAECEARWKKTLHPTRTRVGKFSLEEEKRLKLAMTLFGAQNWHKIARFVPGRTKTQCREIWANFLDPNVNHGKWTKEEDAKLREAMSEHEFLALPDISLEPEPEIVAVKKKRKA
ncbi:unnamed protein product, partial [Eruca vesicaria subsp. sativa]|nr:unnamed protein product [Eruca vesicaria subsp. sativa]